MHGELQQLRDAFADAPDLEALLANPEVDSRVKADVLAGVAAGSDEIVAELDTLVAAEHRVLDVELTTAHELSDEEFGRILGRIESASGRKVQAERKVDPDLIGGIVLQAGSMRLDASVRGRLERLRHDLTHARS